MPACLLSCADEVFGKHKARAMITEALELYLEETAAEDTPQTGGVLTGSVTVHVEDAA